MNTPVRTFAPNNNARARSKGLIGPAYGAICAKNPNRPFCISIPSKALSIL